MPSGLDFLVAQEDLRRTRFAQTKEPETSELRSGEVLLQIDTFGFSANNITYATLGEAMSYWQFFPAPEGWGRVPVWGYAAVAASAHDELEVGERVFGYLPMSTHLVVIADRVSTGGFVDAAPHRADLPPVYQRYTRLGMGSRDPRSENLEALWRPLFMTSFGAADFLADRSVSGAERIVVSSASSKTAMGIAFLLARGHHGIGLVGLTSPRHVPFTERTGYYDRVIPYDGLHELSADVPLLFVDLAGDGRLLSELRRLAGDRLRRNVVVGATHWQERAVSAALGGGEAELFFLPPWMEKRRGELGRGEFARRYNEAWGAFLPTVERWMQIQQHSGRDDVEAVYRRTLDGDVDPAVGQMLSLRD
ncbi:MAG TPA: DUF2855 family protein [Solirubrobacteraceae bacterium]|nr:DUF2855 family protein [Solirubrobacteraceae bacterium]